MAESQWSGAIRRNLAVLVTLSFITAAGFSAANLLLPYYILALKGLLPSLPEKLEAINASRAALEVGGLVTAFMAARAFMAAASGWLSDHLGRKPMIVAGLALYTVTQAAYYAATSVWQLFAVRALQGIASAMTWPVAEALLMDSVPPAVRTRAMSLYVVSFNLGNVAGPLLGSATYAAARALLGPGASVADVFRLPFLMLAVPAAATLAASLLLRDPGHRGHHAHLEAFRGGLRELPAAVKRALAGFYFNALINGIAVGIVSSVMILYIIEYIVHTPEAVGVVMTVPGFAGMLVSYPAARLMDRLDNRSRKRILVATMASSRFLLMTVGYVRSLPLFVVLVSALNMAMNVMLPLLRSLEAGLIPARLRGRVFGLHQAFFNTGMTVGPMIGSWIYQAYHDSTVLPGVTGVEATFLLAGLLGLAGVPLIVLLYDPDRVAEEWRNTERAGA